MLLLGTLRYPSTEQLVEAIRRSEVGMVTVSLRRGRGSEEFWTLLRRLEVDFLPNTAGCQTAEEAMTVAEMSREVFGTHRIKLEIKGDSSNPQPNPFELVKAARFLVDRGFEVWADSTDDLMLNQRLFDLGCAYLTPWAAPTGSGRGICNTYALHTLRRKLPEAKLLIGAGLGAPSQACTVMEMGYDGVMINAAVALANDPPMMAEAFAFAVRAGQDAYRSGLIETQGVIETPPIQIATPQSS